MFVWFCCTGYLSPVTQLAGFQIQFSMWTRTCQALCPLGTFFLGWGRGGGSSSLLPSLGPCGQGHVTHTRFKTQVPTERNVLPFLKQEVKSWEDLTSHSHKIPTFTRTRTERPQEDSSSSAPGGIPGKPKLIHLWSILLVSISGPCGKISAPA